MGYNFIRTVQFWHAICVSLFKARRARYRGSLSCHFLGFPAARCSSHKFREVKTFCDHFTVLRRGRLTGDGDAKTATVEDMSRMMIGDTEERERAVRVPKTDRKDALDLAGLFAEDELGLPAIHAINLKVRAGEIVGIAGVSGNGQSALVEALSGQRQLSQGQIFIRGKDFTPTRGNFDRFKVFGLPEEPLKNAAVPRMSVAENIAFRSFDKAPISSFGWWMRPGPMKKKAEELIARYNVKTTSPDAPIESLSGGNVQRAILARELSEDVDVLIVANPCFGLDFASVADIARKSWRRAIAVLRCCWYPKTSTRSLNWPTAWR
ncbi:MAG: transporter ATP-binding protein [Rhizobium sp.]|nr:transporter ATP-binding protein [Rhizobium sp.]